MKKIKNLTIGGIEPVSATEFNTNNGWGFGGGIGTRYIYPSGATIKIGRAFYRHMPPSNFVTVRNIKGHKVYDGTRWPKDVAEIIRVVKYGK